MRILIAHQYFKTPEEGSGIRSWYLAHAFKSAGHTVSVISGHNNKHGVEDQDGILVNYFKIPYSNYFGFLKRVWAFYRFVAASKKYLSSNRSFDLIYVLSTPLTTGLIGLYAKKKQNIPYAFEVGDLWPLAPIQMGSIRNGWVKKLLYHFEERAYTEASLLVALSPEIKRAMEYTVDYTKEVSVLPNVADCQFFDCLDHIPEKFDGDHPLKIGYQGAIGKANHLDYLVELAKAIKDSGLPIQIRIMGEGSEKDRIVSTTKHLTNIAWVSPGGKKEVKKELNKCHVTYISYASVPVLETGCPNKLFDGLASGKLIIINFKGWIEKLIRSHECGFSYSAEDPKKAIELLKPFLDSPTLLAAYQTNARKLAEESYDVPILMNQAVSLIENYQSEMSVGL